MATQEIMEQIKIKKSSELKLNKYKPKLFEIGVKSLGQKLSEQFLLVWLSDYASIKSFDHYTTNVLAILHFLRAGFTTTQLANIFATWLVPAILSNPEDKE